MENFVNQVIYWIFAIYTYAATKPQNMFKVIGVVAVIFLVTRFLFEQSNYRHFAVIHIFAAFLLVATIATCIPLAGGYIKNVWDNSNAITEQKSRDNANTFASNGIENGKKIDRIMKMLGYGTPLQDASDAMDSVSNQMDSELYN